MNEYIAGRVVERLRKRDFIVEVDEVMEVYETGTLASRSGSGDLVATITTELEEYGVL